jgi:hypothetical protein
MPVVAGLWHQALGQIGLNRQINEEPIAEFLGDVFPSARDGPGGGLLVLRDDVAPFLGVELLRERRRADQIAEEDGQLAALTGVRNVCVERRPRRRAGSALLFRGDNPPLMSAWKMGRRGIEPRTR